MSTRSIWVCKRCHSCYPDGQIEAVEEQCRCGADLVCEEVDVDEKPATAAKATTARKRPDELLAAVLKVFDEHKGTSEALEKLIADEQLMAAIVRVAAHPTTKHFWPGLLRKLSEEPYRLTKAQRDELTAARKAFQARLETGQLGGFFGGAGAPKVVLQPFRKCAMYPPESPVALGTVVPGGYKVTETLVARVHGSGPRATQVHIASTPIAIAGRAAAREDQKEWLVLTWARDSKWAWRMVPRVQCFDVREIVKLAAYGFPVTTLTAGHLVEYLAAFEAANLKNLPLISVSFQMGIQGDELAPDFDAEGGFIVGPQVIQADGISTLHFHTTRPDEWGSRVVAFHGEAGPQQLASGYRPSGTLEDWKALALSLQKYPHFMLALYTSLASSLLWLTRSRGFVLDLCDQSSRGKTTALQFAASAWGATEENSRTSALSTWDATRVWIQRACVTLRSLPLILDDTKRAKDTEVIASVLYDVVSGKERARGTPDGIATAGDWRLNMISSGETPLTSYTQDGGTRARVISLWGSPLGTHSDAMAREANRIKVTCLEHHGHAGPALVAYVLASPDRWSEWRRRYHELTLAYQQRLTGLLLSGRYAGYLAHLELVGRIAEEVPALQLPWSDPISALFAGIRSSAIEADRPAAALRGVVSWAWAHRSDFLEGAPGDARQPGAGYAGRWAWTESKWTHLSFFPHRLNEVLHSLGYAEHEAVLRAWRDRGWLYRPTRGYQRQERVKGERAWLVTLTQDAVDHVLETDPSRTDELPPNESSGT